MFHPDDVDADRIVVLADPRIARVPVVDCGEPVVDAREAAEVAVDDRQADPDGAFALVRSGTLDRLVRAQRLLPSGWQLVLVEGYRPAALQRRYFDEHVASLRRAHPQWTPSRLVEEASRYIAPVEVAPHITGGAVDLTLADPGGAMAAAGFVNYPTEWWHWSIGDRYWAIRVGAPTARYGPMGY